MEDNYIAMVVFIALFYFGLGLGFGWLLSKFLKIVILIFLAVAAIAYGLQEADIMQLNQFAISIKMRELTDIGYVIVRLPYLISFLLGAFVWRRYLTHL